MGGWESSLRDDRCSPTEAGRRIIRGFPITFISQISLPTHAQISREVGGFSIQLLVNHTSILYEFSIHQQIVSVRGK